MTAPAAVVQAPRRCSRRSFAQPAAAAGAAAARSTHDDFGIDLEKELMGEFADFEAPPEAAAAAAAAPELMLEAASQLYAAAGIDAELDDEFHDAFTASFDDDADVVEDDLRAEAAASIDGPAVAAVLHEAIEPTSSAEVADAYEAAELDRRSRRPALELDLKPSSTLARSPSTNSPGPSSSSSFERPDFEDSSHELGDPSRFDSTPEPPESPSSTGRNPIWTSLRSSSSTSSSCPSRSRT